LTSIEILYVPSWDAWKLERFARVMCVDGSPPSLRDLALHTVHTLSFDVAKFKLTREVTYRQYLFACGFTVAGEATPLIPPGSPYISVDF
jgi:hypothetical protein